MMEDAISFNFMSPKFERIRSRIGLALAGFTWAGCVVAAVEKSALSGAVQMPYVSWVQRKPCEKWTKWWTWWIWWIWWMWNECQVSAFKFCLAVLIREPHKKESICTQKEIERTSWFFQQVEQVQQMNNLQNTSKYIKIHQNTSKIHQKHLEIAISFGQDWKSSREIAKAHIINASPPPAAAPPAMAMPLLTIDVGSSTWQRNIET